MIMYEVDRHLLEFVASRAPPTSRRAKRPVPKATEVPAIMAFRLILDSSLTSSTSKGWVPLIDSTGVELLLIWAKLCFRREPILCEKFATGRMVKLAMGSDVLSLGKITQALGPKSETREARPN